jgi:hypothetical protein
MSSFDHANTRFFAFAMIPPLTPSKFYLSDKSLDHTRPSVALGTLGLTSALTVCFACISSASFDHANTTIRRFAFDIDVPL